MPFRLEHDHWDDQDEKIENAFIPSVRPVRPAGRSFNTDLPQKKNWSTTAAKKRIPSLRNLQIHQKHKNRPNFGVLSSSGQNLSIQM